MKFFKNSEDSHQEFIITGSLGDVMRESAQAALSCVRSNADAFGIADDFFDIRLVDTVAEVVDALLTDRQ